MTNTWPLAVRRVMSLTLAPPLTENTVTVTPASPERSLTTHVEGSGTSGSLEAV